MAQQIKLKDGRTALFDDGESQESINKKLKELNLERAPQRGAIQEAIALINEPIVSGASSILGLPGLLESGLRNIERKIGEYVAGRPLTEAEMPRQVLPTAARIRGAAEQIGIPTQTAENVLGRTAQNVLRNVASAPVPGALIPSILSGVGEEAAAYPVRGTQMEPLARAVGAIGTPFVQVPFMVRTPAQRITAEELSRITPAQMTEAQRIQQSAARTGTPVTSAEAIQQAAGGATRMPEVQRMVESSVGGGPIMRQYLAGREAQTRQTLEQMFPTTARAELGVEASQAAQAAQRQAAQEVSAKVGPEFRRLESIQIPETRFNSLVAYDDVIKDVFERVKRNPVRKKQTAGMPENSVGFIEVMRQELGDMLGEAQRAGRSSEARVLQQSYDDIKRFVDDTIRGEYQAALTATRQAREQIQRPLESTPIARIAETEQTAQQFASLFARNAVELNLTPDKVKTTIQAFNKQSPELAKDFVNQYLRGSLEKVSTAAERQLATGGRFADSVWGNETQRRNLIAAYEQAFGKNAAKGLDEMLVSLKAQAQRLPAGSPTQEKTALAQRTEGAVRRAISQPLSAVGALADQIRNGRDMENLARVLTSEDGVRQLQNIAASKDKAKVGFAAVEIQRLLEGATQVE
jgi:hypothetical protein